MTDQPTPRVGDTITTVEQLDALPVGIVLRLAPGLVADKIHHEGDRFPKWAITGYFGPHPLREADLPATVLHRPDAPRPAPVDGDAVERAHRAWDEYPDYNPGQDERDAWTHERDRMAVALAAARDGETVSKAAYDETVALLGQTAETAAAERRAQKAAEAARAGEAVDRGAREYAATVLAGHRDTSESDVSHHRCSCGWEVSGHNPRAAAGHLAAVAVDAFLAARGDAAPSESALRERVAREIEALGARRVPGYHAETWAYAMVFASALITRGAAEEHGAAIEAWREVRS